MARIRDIVILGATGSIGLQTLKICKDKNISVKAIAFNENYDEGIKIIKEYKPLYVAVSSLLSFEKLKELDFKETIVEYGDKALEKALNYSHNIVNAITGLAGLKPTIWSLQENNTLFLANKESLVVAGDLIKKEAKEKHMKIVPIDSEHDAINRLINNKHINVNNKIKKIIITASGGAFRDKTREELLDVSVMEALKHPNWSMGKKITIDSATMVNKGLEVIEAHHLFDIDYDRIDTIIHPESIIHSMVELVDGSVEAVMYMPSMLVPIQNALLGEFENLEVSRIDFVKLSKLSFKEMDYQRFPMIKLAYEVGKKGGFYPTCYNASNEVAVQLFLEGKISFLEIEKIITDMINKFNSMEISKLDYNFDNILLVHNQVIKCIKEVYK